MLRRYPPSTLHIYLDLTSTQRIQTHNSHRHNPTLPGPGPSPLLLPPTHSPPTPQTPKTPPQLKHRYTFNTPHATTGLVKPKLNPLIHSPPRAKHILIACTPPTPFILRTTLIPSTSAALVTIPEPRVPPTHSCHALIPITPPLSPHQHCRHPHTLLSYTHPIKTTVPQPPHPHRVPRQPQRQTRHDHMTTHHTRTQNQQ